MQLCSVHFEFLDGFERRLSEKSNELRRICAATIARDHDANWAIYGQHGRMPIVMRIGCRCHGTRLFARNPQRIFRRARASFPPGNLICPRENPGRGRLELSDVSNQMPFTRYEDVSPRWKLSCEYATAAISDKALIVWEIFLSASDYNIHTFSPVRILRPSSVPSSASPPSSPHVSSRHLGSLLKSRAFISPRARTGETNGRGFIRSCLNTRLSI